MSVTLAGMFNMTSNTPTTAATPTTTHVVGTGDLFNTADGRAVLALLLILMILVLALPVVAVVLVKRFCWIRVEDQEKGRWRDKLEERRQAEEEDNTKETQTELTGEALQEYYNRRKPTDMSQYYGKRLVEVEEPPRFHQIIPKTFNDPWSAKYNGKETNYIARNW